MARRGGIARRSGFVLRGGRMVRETLWANFTTVEAALTGAPTAVLANVTGAPLLAIRPFTVIRARGVIAIRSDQAAATESFMVDVGQCVVSDQAVAIGVTAVPTPGTDAGSDLWYMFQQVIGRIEVSSGAGTGVPVNTQTFVQYDSRAMRKIEEGNQLILVFENELNGANIVHSGRILIKLH